MASREDTLEAAINDALRRHKGTYENDLRVWAIDQIYSDTGMGFGPGGQAITTGFAVVIETPWGDLHVYHGGRHAYTASVVSGDDRRFVIDGLRNLSVPTLVEWERREAHDGA